VSVYSQLSGDTTSLNPPGCGVRQNAPQQEKIVGGYKAKVGGWIFIKLKLLN